MTQAFNLSQLANKVNTSGQLDASTGLYNQTPVANGGTGKSTVTTGALLLGAGTSAMTELTGTTAGTTVVSSPTGWVSAPVASVAGGDYIMQNYTSPNVWTKPATLKAIKVTVVGAGGAGGSAPANQRAGSGGGGGGAAIIYVDAPGLPASPITITAGTGTNSFGSFASGTAGAAGITGGPGSSSTAGGAGGTGSNSPTIPGLQTIIVNGTKGGNAMIFAPGTGNFGLSGAGGQSILGGGGTQVNSPGTTAGNPGQGFGSGGGGSVTFTASSSTGGTGQPGTVIVEEFY